MPVDVIVLYQSPFDPIAFDRSPFTAPGIER